MKRSLTKTFIFLFLFVIFSGCKEKDVEPDKAKIISITASSTLADNNNKYKVQNLIDKDLNTIWAEGVSTSGVGESITITFDKVANLTGFYIQNGLNKEYFYNFNSRVKEFLVNDKFKVIIPDSGIDKFEWIEFKEPQVTKVLTLKIIDTYPGTKYQDTCITEIGFGKNVDIASYTKRISRDKIYSSKNDYYGTLFLKVDGSFELTYTVKLNLLPSVDDLPSGITNGTLLKVRGRYTLKSGKINLNYGEATGDPGSSDFHQPTIDFPGEYLDLILDKNSGNEIFEKIWSRLSYEAVPTLPINVLETKIEIKLFKIAKNSVYYIIPADPQFGFALSFANKQSYERLIFIFQGRN